MILDGVRTKLLPALRARWYLRGAKRLGPRVRLWGSPAIHIRGTLLVGDRVRLISTTAQLEIGVEATATLEIGDGTFINYGCSIVATEHVRIGPRCNIGTHVIIMDNQFHKVAPDRRMERPPSAGVSLGENVWLGARVIVLPGVTIGDHSVIGAGSVVTRNIPPRVVAAGLPARVLREIDNCDTTT